MNIFVFTYQYVFSVKVWAILSNKFNIHLWNYLVFSLYFCFSADCFFFNCTYAKEPVIPLTEWQVWYHMEVAQSSLWSLLTELISPPGLIMESKGRILGVCTKLLVEYLWEELVTVWVHSACIYHTKNTETMPYMSTFLAQIGIQKLGEWAWHTLAHAAECTHIATFTRATSSASKFRRPYVNAAPSRSCVPAFLQIFKSLSSEDPFSPYPFDHSLSVCSLST